MNIIRELFYILTVALSILVGLELVWPNLILVYFNINWLLLAWIFVGIIHISKGKIED
jgi:hypothetical protein